MTDRPLTARPLTKRGRRTRNALIEAAREVFEEKGFEETRVAEITGRAGLAYGSFYTYFDSKDALLREVAKGMTAEMFDASRSGVSPDADPIARIRHSTERFLRLYRDNARIMHVLEQVAPRHAHFNHIYLEIRGLFVDRISASIRRLQEEDLADPDLDPDTTAGMLGGMVEHFARVWFLYEQEHDPEVAVETATRLWARGIGLDYPGPSHTEPRVRDDAEGEGRGSAR